MYGKLDGTGYEVLDSSFKECINGNAHVERLWTGGRWAEGPAWFAAGRYLVWSDIPNNRMLRLDECDGHVSEFRIPCNNSNGNTVDGLGRLLTCEHLTRRVTRTEFDGSVTIIADSFNGRRFNSPNDLVTKSDGSIWFTDPSYGILSDYEGMAADQEQDGCHVYRVDVDGSITRVCDDFVKPNGIAFSPDESCLYVADTGASHQEGGPRHIRKFAVDDKAPTVSGGEVFAECTEGLFDGFRSDCQGRVWTSAADGVHCYDSAGTMIGKVLIPEVVANVTFGGPKRNRLYICATTSLYAVTLMTRGVGFG